MNCYNCKNLGCALCVAAYDIPSSLRLSAEETDAIDADYDTWTDKERLTKNDREFLVRLSDEVMRKKGRK